MYHFVTGCLAGIGNENCYTMTFGGDNSWLYLEEPVRLPAQPGLTWSNLEGYPAQPGLTWRSLEGYPAQSGLIHSFVCHSVHL